jgi:hypothetical protein
MRVEPEKELQITYALPVSEFEFPNDPITYNGIEEDGQTLKFCIQRINSGNCLRFMNIYSGHIKYVFLEMQHFTSGDLMALHLGEPGVSILS